MQSKVDQVAADQIFDLINNSIMYGSTAIKMYMVDGIPWFCAKDVTSILGYENSPQAIRINVDQDDRKSLDSLHFSVGYGIAHLNKNELKAIYINEGGLYSLIMSSKLETAKKFKKWVTSQVLTKIRKYGTERYMAQIKNLQETNIVQIKNI